MDCPVKIKIKREDGEVLRIDGKDWIIPNDGLNGFGELNNTIFSHENVVRYGSTVDGSRVDSTEREIKAEVKDAKNNEVMRDKATRFFNFNKRFRIYTTYMGKTRHFDCIVKKIFCPAENIYKKVFFDVILACENPYFKSEQMSGSRIEENTKLLCFPYVCEEGRKVKVGEVSDKTNRIKIENNGDTYTYCKIIFKNLGSNTIYNPSVTILGKRIKLNTEIRYNDILVFDFTKVPIMIEKNGEDCSNEINPLSNFSDMAIPVGETIISYNTDSEEYEKNLFIIAVFNNLYQTI